MPILRHRFQVVAPNLVNVSPSDVAYCFTQNVFKVDVDMVNKILKVKVRQSADVETFQAIKLLISQKWIPEVQMSHGGSFEDGFVMQFTGALGVGMKHDMTFDYGSAEPLVHELEWKFDNVSMTPMKDEAPHEETPPDPNFITPAEAIAAMTKDIAEK